MSARLSVVVPVHDVGPWIGEQLDCILRQPDVLEVIVIDDHSDDGTAEVVRRAAERDDRLRLHSAVTPGGAAARNLGIDLAAGAFLAFADGDDLVPDGAYRRLLEALERSDAPMAIGRHLKFSSGATWEPMSPWYDVSRQDTVDLDGLPELLANRACWNRVFRTAFLRGAGIRFPEVPRSNDIVPMVRAMDAADSIAMVPEVVYLYRDRPGTSSMTARAAGIDGTLSYLAQEEEVAAVLTHRSLPVRQEHARVVLDADGWVHLRQFLLAEHSATDIMRLMAAVRTLLAVIPTNGRDNVASERRLLWALLAVGEGDAAVRFVRAAHTAGGAAGAAAEHLDAWSDALEAVDRTPDATAFPLDRGRLVNDGPWTLLANRAEHTDVRELDAVLSRLATLTSDVDARSEVLRGVAAAVRRRDAELLQRVSSVRRLAPLVVDEAHPDERGLTLAGPIPDRLPPGISLTVALTGGEGDPTLHAVHTDAGRWTTRINEEDLGSGRHRTVLRVDVGGVSLDLPVVTARMPLPPVSGRVHLQPLADRADGWRFLVDRRAADGPIARRVFRAVRGRLRR